MDAESSDLLCRSLLPKEVLGIELGLPAADPFLLSFADLLAQYFLIPGICSAALPAGVCVYVC